MQPYLTMDFNMGDNNLPNAIKATNDKMEVVGSTCAVEDGKWSSEYTLPDGTKVKKIYDNSGTALDMFSRFVAIYGDYLRQEDRVAKMSSELANAKSVLKEDQDRITWVVNK